MKACRQLCPWNTLYGCKKPESEPCILSNMPCESFEQKPQTNADHIRSMTDEELAKFILQSPCDKVRHDDFDCYGACEDCVSIWLKQPYKED